MHIYWWSIPAYSILGIWIASAVYVHFRGKVKLKFMRQLGDHSTFLAPYNAFVYMFSKVPNKPILDNEGFPELLKLRDNWQMIRDEAMRLYEEGHIKKSESHSDLAFNSFFKRGWKRFYLKWYDDVMPSAAELCPKTVELVKSIPTVNAALFALLPARSKLGAHRDPFAGSIRYHLGLMTPNSDDCRIYIDGDPYSWRDGQDVLFDETYIHSVRNDTDSARLILFCDVLRPMKPVADTVNKFVCHKIVKISQAQNNAYEKVGVLNRVSKYLFSFREISERLREKNKYAAKALNYTFTLGCVAAVVMLFVWLHHRH